MKETLLALAIGTIFGVLISVVMPAVMAIGYDDERMIRAERVSRYEEYLVRKGVK